MWVKFKVYWQDGLQKYTPGKICDIPADLAVRYIESGKAVRSEPKKSMVPEVKTEKGKKKFPSARRRIKKMSTIPQRQMSLDEIADELMGDD